ncbi:hypothetical protein LTR17_019529 [Elasticomyces elasticus]|nr:hypothetical protein LTR17_019529 [Elasticomyces elasticus]
MAPHPLHYKLKESAGKGLGIFATEDLEPGTIIMRDCVLMKVYKPDYRSPDEALVIAAYNALDKKQKDSFLRLHEGSRPYGSKVMRIYMANSFRSRTEFSNYVLPKMSRVNHSCTPNTEKAADDDDKSVEILVAVKPIAKDEEIFHGYFGFPAALTKNVRIKLLSAWYGFACDCSACTLSPASTAISDARRRLIEVLKIKISGFGPTDWSNIDTLTPENVNTFGLQVGHLGQALTIGLTVQQKLAYWIMAAKLCQAEGFVSSQVATFYEQAADRLRLQMEGLGEGLFVITDSARILLDWLTEAMLIATQTRGRDAKVTKEMRRRLKETLASNVGFAIMFIDRLDEADARTDKEQALHDAFAIDFVGSKKGIIKAVSEDVCLKLFRKNLIWKESSESAEALKRRVLKASQERTHADTTHRLRAKKASA